MEWLYFPHKRRKKRNLDELYSIKSVTDSTSKFLKNTMSYSSLLSTSDIDICNKILATLHRIYFKNFDIRKFLIKLFYSIDNYEYSYHELNEEQKNKFKLNFQNTIIDNTKNSGFLRIVIDMNPKISPSDIKNLITVCIKIMKEKIDVGFNRLKKLDKKLANSFNPLEKYYQIYDRKLFRLFKRVQ